MNTNFRIKTFLIFVIPIIFLIAGINFNRPRYINDPNYIYLMNALCICNGESVGNIDNPGTTVMQATAATIGIVHLLSHSKNESLINHVIKSPEKFIDYTRYALIFLNSIVLISLGWIAIKKTGSFWLALLLQASTFLSTNTLDYIWSKLSPESLLFFFTSIFVLILLCFYSEQDKTKWKYVFIFSLATGAGLATKANFLPLTVFPIVVLPTIKRKIYYLIGIIPSFVLFTIPAIPEYENLYHWIKSLITHAGIYGNGERKIVDFQTYFPNIIEIFKDNPILIPLFFSSLLFLSIHFLLKKNGEINWEERFLSGLAATLLIGIILVAKHYREHYILPVLLLSGITLYFLLKLISQYGRSNVFNKMLLSFFSILITVIVATQQPQKMQLINNQNKATNVEIESTNALIDLQYSEYTRINYYIFSLNKFTGLKFGNDFAKQKLLRDLLSFYPDTYFYEFSKDEFLNWNQRVQLNDIVQKHGEKLLLVNGPADTQTIEEIANRGFPLRQIYEGKAQNLYILDSLEFTP